MTPWGGVITAAALVGIVAGVLGGRSRSVWRFSWGGFGALVVLMSAGLFSNSPIRDSSDVSKSLVVAVAGIVLGGAYYTGLVLVICARAVGRRR